MANLALITSRKTADYRSPISKHLDEWERISIDHRDRSLGRDWYNDVEAFYRLTSETDPLPSFRPAMRIPQLQVLMMHEANDLSETSPRPYITDNSEGKRDESREKALQCQWRQSQINYHAMYTTLMSLFTGMCPMQIGFSPDARQGRGALWAKMRDPRTFNCDPWTDYTLNWSYLILEDRMHLEEVKSIWGAAASQVRPRVQGRSVTPFIGDSGYGVQMPAGPMSMVPGLPSNKAIPDDNRVRVRRCFCLDYTRQKIESDELPEGAIIPADFEWKYPNGRMIVECEGYVLQDGDNPFPLKMFPIVPFWSTLPLFGIWTVPAIRYSMQLQGNAERLYTQLFENAVRVNNGVWFIDERTGIDTEAFGGIPGEVQVINANSPVPQCVAPQGLSQQAYQFPQILLDKQKELQGFTDARAGKPGAGNISPELFDESVVRSQGVTQLRGRLNALSFQRITDLMFYTMARYMKPQTMFDKSEKGYDPIKWEPVTRPDQYDVELDPASLRPFSQTMLRKLAGELRKAGLLGVRRTLQAIDWPDAESAAEEVEQEQALAALAKTRGAKK
jgi:hypothetical protein